MIRATLHTRHFTFDAYAATEEAAMSAMRLAWDTTHRQHYPDAATFDEFVEEGDIEFHDFGLGEVYRDGERILEVPRGTPDADLPAMLRRQAD